jgi:hypothetical protein
MDLTGSYDKFINGAPGSNPYLTGAIQKGINQSSNAFGNMVTDAKAATQDVLGNIRSNSVLSGQYGGSRQGLAEGKAIESMNTQLGRAASQFGQNNTDAAVTAQAGAYDADSSRALAATQGLGAQQYGVAGQNAAFQQQAASTNYAGDLGTHQAQAGLDSTKASNNLQAQLSTNGLNATNVQSGMSNLNGILGGAYTAGQTQDNHALNQATQVNGLLQPYLGQPGATVQPTYQGSTAGGLLGGAAAGVGLYNQFNPANKPAANGASSWDSTMASYNSGTGY